MSKLVKVVNLEDGMPSVEQARARLNSELSVARAGGVKILKIIHGYDRAALAGIYELGCRPRCGRWPNAEKFALAFTAKTGAKPTSERGRCSSSSPN